MTNHTKNAQLASIIDKLTTSHYYESTLGRLQGRADDTCDPDNSIDNNDNTGFLMRQSIWCTPDIVHLTGPLYSSISTNIFPIPSDIEISIAMTRNKDSVLITQNDQTKNDLFRITLIYLEIIIPRIIIKSEIQKMIEIQMEKKPIELVYNRLEMRSFLITPGTLSFETESLFLGYDIVSFDNIIAFVHDFLQ